MFFPAPEIQAAFFLFLFFLFCFSSRSCRKVCLFVVFFVFYRCNFGFYSALSDLIGNLSKEKCGWLFFSYQLTLLKTGANNLHGSDLTADARSVEASWKNTVPHHDPPRLGLCHNTLAPAKTPRRGLCHNTLTPATTPRLGCVTTH